MNPRAHSLNGVVSIDPVHKDCWLAASRSESHAYVYVYCSGRRHVLTGQDKWVATATAAGTHRTAGPCAESRGRRIEKTAEREREQETD